MFLIIFGKNVDFTLEKKFTQEYKYKGNFLDGIKMYSKILCKLKVNFKIIILKIRISINALFILNIL